MLRTTNSGVSWDPIYLGNGNVMRGVFFINPDTGFICSVGAILRTEDGGFTWNQQISDYVWLRRFSFPSEEIGYCVGDYHTIYKTYNGGYLWSCISQSGTYNLTAVSFATPEIGYIAGHNGTSGFIEKTVDGGASWVLVYENPSIIIENGLFALNADVVYACGAGGTIVKTTNGGVSWVEEVSNTEWFLRGLYFFPSGVGFVCGHNGILLKNQFCTEASFTFDLQSLEVTFTNQSQCENSWWWNFGDGYYSDLENPWHLYETNGTYNVCLTVSDTISNFSDTFCDSVRVNNVGIETRYSSVSLYPNPCQNRLYIDGDNRLKVCNVRLYNTLGCQFLTEKVEMDPSNKTFVNIELPDGLYLAVGLYDNKIIFSKKVLVLN